MTYSDKLRQFAADIGSLGGNVYHYHRPRLAFPCIVWAEEGCDAIHTDNTAAEQSPRGTLDYFTKLELDPMADAIMDKLQSIGCAWALESVQYELDTGIIHHEWSWEV